MLASIMAFLEAALISVAAAEYEQKPPKADNR